MKKLIFIKNPKTASTSIYNSLLKTSNLNADIYEYKKYEENPNYLEEKNCIIVPSPSSQCFFHCYQQEKNFFVFGVLRNIFDRFISGWNFMANIYGVNPTSNIFEYFKFLEDYKNKEKTNIHLHLLRSQKENFYYNNQIVVNRFLNFSRLEQDFKKLQNEFGFKSDLLKLNEGLKINSVAKKDRQKAAKKIKELMQVDYDWFKEIDKKLFYPK